MLIILADAEVELIPEVMREDAEIKEKLKSEGKTEILLDSSTMEKAIEKFFPLEAGRIGFPYIAYMFYRMNEETLLKDRTELEYVIHTKNGIILEMEEFKDCGIGYQNFKDVLEEKLVKNRKRISLLQYLDSRTMTGHTVVLHPLGRKDVVINDQLNFIIGGFPNGDFRSDLGNIRKFSIYDREVTVPAVLELLHFRIFQQSALS